MTALLIMGCEHRNTAPYLERGWPIPCENFRGAWVCHHLERCVDCKEKLGSLPPERCPLKGDT